MSGTVRISNQITVTPPTRELLDWTSENMVLPNPEYIKRERMGLWLGKTPKNIALYQIQGGSLVYPYGVLKDVLKICKGYQLIPQFETQPDIDFGGTDVPLYDYQQLAVAECVKRQMGILQSPAGSGKTQMGVAIFKAIGKRTLWLTHTRDLLNQSKERAKLYIGHSLIGEITDGEVHIGQGVTFATVQTMCKMDLSGLKNYWDVIICDECHRIAGSPTMVTQFSRILNALAARHKYGLSATVHRSDGMIRQTFSLLGDICYSVPEEAVKGKVLTVGVRPVTVNTQDSREYLSYDGMLSYSKLISYICSHEGRNELIAQRLAKDFRHSCLVLSDRVEHLTNIMNLLPQSLKQKSVLISGKTKTIMRERALNDMRQGGKTILFATYSLAKEGLDIPILSRLYLTTPHKDEAVIIQSIGRIARVHPNKPTPIAYDFVDVNIRYLANAYKTRRGIYKKCHCEFL